MERHISTVVVAFLCVSMARVATSETESDRLQIDRREISEILDSLRVIKVAQDEIRVELKALMQRDEKTHLSWTKTTVTVILCLVVPLVLFCSPSLRPIIKRVRGLPFPSRFFDKITALREDNFFFVVGEFLENACKGVIDPSNLITIATTFLYHVVADYKESCQDSIIRLSYNYWEEHPLPGNGGVDKRFMFNALSEDKKIQEVFDNAFPPSLTFVLSQMTTSANPFVVSDGSLIKDLFPKIGALISGMNCTELLRSSLKPVGDTQSGDKKFHTLVLGVCFEPNPQGSKKFRILIMEEGQLRDCLGGDDPNVYIDLDHKEKHPPPIHYGGKKTEGCPTPLPQQREERLRVMRVMANLWFNSNGGEDVNLRAGDLGLNSFKLKKHEFENAPTVLKNDAFCDQLKSFFAGKASEFADLVEKRWKEGISGLGKKQFAEVFPQYSEKPPKRPWGSEERQESEEHRKFKEWQHDWFYSRLVIVDNKGTCHKLQEIHESKLNARAYDWSDLAIWLTDANANRFIESDDAIRARLTPMKRRKQMNRILTNADRETRAHRGLTSVDVYGLAE